MVKRLRNWWTNRPSRAFKNVVLEVPVGTLRVRRHDYVDGVQLVSRWSVQQYRAAKWPTFPHWETLVIDGVLYFDSFEVADRAARTIVVNTLPTHVSTHTEKVYTNESLY